MHLFEVFLSKLKFRLDFYHTKQLEWTLQKLHLTAGGFVALLGSFFIMLKAC